MDNNASNQNTASSETAANNLRKAYVPPVLTKYGSVSTLTQSGSGTNNEGSGSTKSSRKNASDLRLKEHISRIGQHPLGFGIYLFDYKAPYKAAHGSGRMFGVIAQEVEAVVPAAVSVNSDGFKVVDYNILGISPTLH